MKDYKNGIKFTKFGVSESDLIRLFIEKMRRYGAVKSGTYNKQDPTHWEEIITEMIMDNGQADYSILVEITVFGKTTIRFTEFGKELAQADWDPQDKKWINVNAPGFFDVLNNVFVNGKHESEMTI